MARPGARCRRARRRAEVERRSPRDAKRAPVAEELDSKGSLRPGQTIAAAPSQRVWHPTTGCASLASPRLADRLRRRDRPVDHGARAARVDRPPRIMSGAVVMHAYGGPEVLAWTSMPLA